MKEERLYLECSFGISAEMLAGALLDLGASPEKVRDGLEKLPMLGCGIEFKYEYRRGIRAAAFQIRPSAGETGQMPAEAFACGKLCAMLQASRLSPWIRDRAQEILHILAEAKARVHRGSAQQALSETISPGTVGGILAVLLCMEELGLYRVLLSAIYEGGGHVQSEEGWLPVPVPEVLEITQEYGLPLVLTQLPGPMVTPEGAAMAAVLADKKAVLSQYRIEKVGIGCGEEMPSCAHILRAMRMKPVREEKESVDSEEADRVWVLETNVDDCTGEQIGYAIERLLDAGAKDASAMPLFMKKHRPAYLLQVICDEGAVEALEAILFRETTSIGLRKYQAGRRILKRRMEEVDTPYGKIRVKCCTHGSARYCYPEYECLKKIALEHKLPYPQIYQEVLRIIEDRNSK